MQANLGEEAARLGGVEARKLLPHAQRELDHRQVLAVPLHLHKGEQLHYTPQPGDVRAAGEAEQLLAPGEEDRQAREVGRNVALVLLT